MTVRNWSGSVEFNPESVMVPSSLGDLRDRVTVAADSGKRVRAIGSGHSFTPLVETSEILVRLDEIRHVGALDSSGVIPVGAGIKLWQLGPALRALGRAQENLGDINAQSLAGAVSTGTHGTGLGLKTISNQAQWLRVLSADGEIRHWDRDKHPDDFRAAATSLGALGLIVEIGLKTVPAYGLECRQFAEDLDLALASFERRCREHRHHEFFWFPHTNTVLSKVSDALEDPGKEPSKVARFLGDVVLENGVFETINQIVRLFPSQAPRACRALAALSRLAGGKTLRGPSDSVFATARLSRFQEMEYGLPIAQLSLAMERVRRFIEDEKIAVSFPIEVRAVRGDDLWLSPAFGRDSVFIAVHMHHALPHEKYFAGVEAIFTELGGRPHWGKMHTKTSRELAALYPHWADFRKLRESLDPRGVFLNPHLEKLLS
jgi:FAD-linked oxidoreductase